MGIKILEKDDHSPNKNNDNDHNPTTISYRIKKKTKGNDKTWIFDRDRTFFSKIERGILKLEWLNYYTEESNSTGLERRERERERAQFGSICNDFYLHNIYIYIYINYREEASWLSLPGVLKWRRSTEW